MRIKLLLLSLVALLVSSCSTIRHTASSVDVDNKVVSFTVADLDVQNKKATKTYNWNYNPFRRVSVNNIKENITAELINENNADVLLEPQYIVVKRGFLRGGSVTITGIPATYSNFHKMTPEEAKIVGSAFREKKVEKKKRWFFF